MEILRSILLVDDDIDDQSFFIEALNEVGNAILVGIANDGKQALEKLSSVSFRPDFIFLDINMPVMNGLECLSEIRKNPDMRDIRVVILSTSDAQEELALKLGAVAYIQKPSDGNTLRSKIQQLIGVGEYSIPLSAKQ